MGLFFYQLPATPFEESPNLPDSFEFFLGGAAGHRSPADLALDRKKEAVRNR
jgi:hypothetical protein